MICSQTRIMKPYFILLGLSVPFILSLIIWCVQQYLIIVPVYLLLFYPRGWNLYVLLGLWNTCYTTLLLYAILSFFYRHVHFCWCIGAFYMLWILINPLEVNIYSNILPFHHFYSLWNFLTFWNIFFCGMYFPLCFASK